MKHNMMGNLFITIGMIITISTMMMIPMTTTTMAMMKALVASDGHSSNGNESKSELKLTVEIYMHMEAGAISGPLETTKTKS